MALKKFELSDGLIVTVFKRRRSRSLRLSITAAGDVRVSIPFWATYSSGVSFAKSRLGWILEQRQMPELLTEGQVIGKSHSLRFRVSARAIKPSSRLEPALVIITHPLAVTSAAAGVQAVAERAAIRALRKEATSVLPNRLRRLAAEYGFSYADVTIKQLTSRWGSCDQQQHIALNLFLMQLPWELIDYVLLHELVHTRHLHHGEDFWKALEAVAPGAKKLRTEIHKHKPVVLR